MKLNDLALKSRELDIREAEIKKREEKVAIREKSVEGILSIIKELSSKIGIKKKKKKEETRKSYNQVTWLTHLNNSKVVIDDNISRKPLLIEWLPSVSICTPSEDINLPKSFRFKRDHRWIGGFCSMWRLLNRITCNLNEMHTDVEYVYVQFKTVEEANRSIVLLKTRFSTSVERVSESDFMTSKTSVGVSPVSAWHWDPQSLVGEWFITAADANFESRSFIMTIHIIAPEQGNISATLQGLKSRESNHVLGFFDRAKQMCVFPGLKSDDCTLLIKTCAGGHRLVGYCHATPTGDQPNQQLFAQLDGVRRTGRKASNRKYAWEADVQGSNLCLFAASDGMQQQHSEEDKNILLETIPALVAGHYGAFVRSGLHTFESLHNPGWSIGCAIASDGFVSSDAKWFLTDAVVGIKFTSSTLVGKYISNDPGTDPITVTVARTTESGNRCQYCYQPVAVGTLICPACDANLGEDESQSVIWMMTIPAYGKVYPVCTQSNDVLKLEIVHNNRILQLSQIQTSQGGWGSCFTLRNDYDKITATIYSQAHSGCDSLTVRGTLQDNYGLADFSLQQMPWGRGWDDSVPDSIVGPLSDCFLSKNSTWVDTNDDYTPEQVHKNNDRIFTSELPKEEDTSVISRIKGMLNEVSFSDDAFQEIIGPLLGPLIEKVKSEEGANEDPASMEVVSLALEAMKFSRGIEDCDGGTSFSMSGSSVARSCESCSDDTIDSEISDSHYLNEDEIFDRHYEVQTHLNDQQLEENRLHLTERFVEAMEKMTACAARNTQIFDSHDRKSEEKQRSVKQRVGLPTSSVDFEDNKREVRNSSELKEPLTRYDKPIVDWIEVSACTVEKSVATCFLEGYGTADEKKKREILLSEPISQDS